MQHRILLLGSGGREHTLAWKMSKSLRCEKLFVAPGNAGTASMGCNVSDLSISDFDALGKFAVENAITMLVVGPEDPLVAGVTDYFETRAELKHIRVMGPSKAGAQLEGSKSFAKEYMQDLSIPTAAYRCFEASELADAQDFIRTNTGPYVLKADGLAAGKGVVIESDPELACAEVADMLGGRFGTAGHRVVIEQFLTGIEFSMFVLTDGENYQILPVAKDYKRVGEGDTGPNTGGMGSVSPPPFVDAELMQKVETRIVQPTVAGLRKHNLPYRGIIFVGLINVAGDPYVIEYNCRFGDPETESVLPRLQNDLVQLFDSLFDGTLAQQKIQTDPRTVVTLMLTAGGYPNDYRKGDEISGLMEVSQSRVFMAGTKLKEGKVVSNGGRVMALTAFGQNHHEALEKVMTDAAKVHFADMNFRKDIGFDL